MKKIYLITFVLFLATGFSFAQQMNSFEKFSSEKDRSTVISSQSELNTRNGKANFILETFDTEIPDTWTITTDPGAVATWEWESGYATIDSDAAGSGTILGAGHLYTPIVDLTGETMVLLEFDHFYRHLGSSYATVEVYDGENWQLLITYNVTTANMAHAEFDVTAYINENFQVRFYYNDASGWNWYWRLDNVTVYTPEDNDLGVTSISPTTSSSPYMPKVTIFNYGALAQSTWSVNLTNGEDYDETIENPGTIEPSESLELDFPEWIALPNTYTFTATVILEDDGNPDNDELSKQVLIYDFSPAIYEQNELVTHPGQGFNGADASALHSGLTVWGSGFQISANNTLADDFIVPENEEWTVNGFTFYAYQTGSTTTSTINDVKIRVYDGAPNSGGVIIQDFWTTNSLILTEWAGIYRTSSDDYATANTRPIMFMLCAVPEFTLTEGEYWVEVSVGGTLASGPWCPPRTILDQTTTGNAIQSITGTWGALVDGTYPQGIPFNVHGTITDLSTKYLVTFVVTDGTNPVQDAVVSLDNDQELLTNDNGEAAFELNAGSYLWSVTKDGYTLVSGELIVVDEDKTINVTIVPSTDLSLTVKMRVWYEEEKFDPEEDFVDVAGTFNGWGETAMVLDAVEEDPDLAYSIIIPKLAIGSTHEFKFRINGSWDDNTSEFPMGGPNRVVAISSGENVYTYWYNDNFPSSANIQSLNQVRSYPNPFSDKISITNAEMVKLVIVTNLIGQRVMVVNLNGEETISTSNLSPGVYLVIFEGINGDRVVRKMVKQ